MLNERSSKSTSELNNQVETVLSPAAVLKQKMGFGEFILLMAALTSIVAFSIDIVLPALPNISADYSLTNDNDRQLVIVAFIVCFGITQLIFGPLADRFGRKWLTLGGLAVYAVASFAASFAPNFETLLIARACQAVGASAVRITTSAIVRDCFEGRDMARVMSYIFTTFMVVPIFAPALGQAFLYFAEWHLIFTFLGVGSILMGYWGYSRLDETLAPEDQRSLSPASIFTACKEIATNRISAGYSIATTLYFGALFSMVVSVQQIFVDVFGLGDWFAIAFAGNACGMAVTSFANARLVRSIGMRRMSHGAMVTFALASISMFAISQMAVLPILAAYILVAIAMMSFGLVAGNFNSIAMQPLGHIAGTATSVIGTLTFTGGAVLGGIVGQAFDGTIVPLATAFLIFGLAAMLIVFVTEGGRLFNAENG